MASGSPPSPEADLHPSPPQSQPSKAVAAALPTSAPSSRRLPPPCWSHDETIALIDAYRDKWYSLRRGNLKAFHWQEVADAVAGRCPLVSPPKTAVQCRHKMEKLRKRYRSEIQRAKSMPHSRFVSAWVHFKRMDAMEKGPSLAKPVTAYVEEEEEEEESEEEEEEYPDVGRFGRNNGVGSGSKVGFGLVGNGVGGYGSGGNSGGFRIKIPNGVSVAKPGSASVPGGGFRANGGGYVNKYDEEVVHGASPGMGHLAVRGEGGSGGYWKGPGGARAGGVGVGGSGLASGIGLGKREREGGDAMAEMVSAINMLADGFVKTEQRKMDMAREIEMMRMDMETKRLKMVLESQERVMEAFIKAASDKRRS